ncbi:peptidylprolyl isomerase [Candidatus Leptofilum sp.]|uniref:peptidylprolyl isomerase n=1 Tax=Candidatus Leptofilum sp. TaxID=3241576 RepID=UPI003B5C5C50
METKLSRWCDGLIEVGWLFVVIAVPLFFNIHSDRVFEPDKLTLMRSIALVMGVAWLVKFVDLRQWELASRLRWRADNSFWRMPFLLIITLLVLVYIISSIFSVTPAVSWAGSYQRLQGTYTTLSYIVIFGTTIATMRTRAQVRRLVTAVIITSIPVAFYGLLQHFDLDPLPWAGDVTQRVAGHMGNAIFIAAYLIMAVPLTVARIIASFSSILSDEELSGADVMRSSAYIFAVAIQLIAIYWSGSRGPWLGLGAGLFAFILVVLVGLRNAAKDQGRFRLKEAGTGAAFVLVGTAVSYTVILLILRGLTGAGLLASLAGAMSSFVAFVFAVALVVVGMFVLVAARRGWRWLWFSWIVMSAVLAIWLVLFNLPSDTNARLAETPVVGNVFTTLNEWRELPRIGRLGQVLEADTGTGRVRTLIWEGALELIQPHEPITFPDGSSDTFNFLRPFIGYGPESMYVAYNSFYPPELATLEARNASPDRSHNETFDALVITGVLGFLIWQALYLSVFLYSFRWLGVLRSKFERNLLIGLWIGVGVITAVAFTIWGGAVYIGVALPFGSILGLVLYLIYYALFASSDEKNEQPFAAERLLVVALVAAILAHFVEIHFGIAISATRLHFFLYVGLLFIITYWLPQQQGSSTVAEEDASTPSRGKGRRRRAGRKATTPAVFASWTGPVLLYGFMLTLLIGIIGFSFITYSQPPNLVIENATDLTALDVLNQSLFVNIKRDFIESPFVYLMLVLAWSLGLLIAVSEMVKDGELKITAVSREINDSRQNNIAITFLVVGAVSLLFRLIFPLPDNATATALLGQTLLWIWGALCLWAGGNLMLALTKNARLFAAGVAVTGLLFSLPVIVGGGFLAGLGTVVFSGIILYYLWDPAWRNLLTPVGLMATISFVFGLLYALFQANLYRYSLLYRAFEPPPQTVEQLPSYLIDEAAYAADFLTYFYIFVFLLMVVAAFAVSTGKKPRLRRNGSTPGYAILAILMAVASVMVVLTNLQIVQADIVYKRGRFYDSEAAATGDPNAWEYAIAIYQDAIDRAPNEDFYYLFLGRSYLELSNVTTDLVRQEQLLAEAEQQLFIAQEINPLNTDHTANLARLNTLWANSSGNDAVRAQNLADAEQFYKRALELSPQNSIIRNEYARLVLSQGQNCVGGLDIYEQSATIDPFYADTFFTWADAAAACAAEADGADADAFYAEAVTALRQGLDLEPDNARAWLRAGQLYQRIDEFTEAIAAYDEALLLDPSQQEIPAWNVKYLQAQAYRDLGQLDEAEALVAEVLQLSPPEYQGEIQLFLQQLRPDSTSPASSVDEERPLANIPPAERNNFYSEYPAFVIDLSQMYEAIIQTEKGELRLRLFPEEAPLAVNSFVFLAQQGFYDVTTFHRVLADFVAQGGDPTGTGGGEPGYRFTDEVDNGLTFDRPGLLAMANAGTNTNGSQFFITFAEQPALNGRHTIFGELIAGEDVLQSLTLRDPEQNPEFIGDQIVRIDIIEVADE